MSKVVPATRRLFPIEMDKLTMRARALRLLDALRARPKLRSKPQDRLQRLCTRIATAIDPVFREGFDDYPFAWHALKDLQEYWFVLEVLGDAVESDTFLRVFRDSLQDDATIDHESNPSPGRDAQFELFVGATAFRCGMSVTRVQAEGRIPDWRWECPATRVLVECKRVRTKSWESVIAKVTDAAEQIDPHRLAGIVFVDLSLGVGEKRVDPATSDEDLDRAFETRGEAWRDDLLAKLKAALPQSAVGLVVLHDYAIRPQNLALDRAAPRLMGSWYALHLRAPGSDAKERFDRAWELFGPALPQW